MRWTGNGSGFVTARFGGRALALLAGAAILAACAAPGGGASNPPATAGPTTPAATTAPATNPPATTAAGPTVTVSTVGAFGSVVTGIRGLSLYLFTNDHDGTSACSGACVGTWPPLTVASASALAAGSGVTGTLGTITRADGSLQVTLGGAPLYYYSGDSAAGATNGQGLFDKWYLVAPSGSPVTGATGGASPAASKCSGPTCY
jgi:predicted lipoprotein with Yx(FWY)xxD motif